MGRWGEYGGWPEYVPVAKKIARAKKAAEKLRKKGVDLQPVELRGRKIATSFWGKGWCDHMDSFHDYENRLPRGRSYVRNGSVVHLEVGKGVIRALVAGSDTYSVEIKVKLLSPKRWDWIKQQCAGQISSILGLLQGKLSDGVMRVVTDPDSGLFPGPSEFTMKCGCPDYAGMCKHIAAVFYGVGARLDARPELLFLLRGVDHAEFAVDGGVESVIAKGGKNTPQFAGADLSEIFGIDLVNASGIPEAPAKAVAAAAASSRKNTVPGNGKAAKTTAKSLATGAKAPVESTAKRKAKKAKAVPQPLSVAAPKRSGTTEERAAARKTPKRTARKTRRPDSVASQKRESAKRLDKALKMVKECVTGKKAHHGQDASGNVSHSKKTS